jgi:class 3 adenylate cyclase/tetratricopeptide (TPR) repeat protein
MDVGDWLRSLGLAQYEPVFRQNDIDAGVLEELTESDLAQLGLSLGHRKRVLRAIAELGAARTPAKAAATADVAERRQLTVMFCDLVDSTAMSARLDPEDMREVISAYQDACSGAVARYDGFVAKFMGDGMLAYFGFPRAHEEDAERAVRAGLDILAAAAKLDTRAKETLRVRIGVATGIVVVGELVGQGLAQEHAVFGETPNLAARLLGVAQPGSITIAEATRRLLGGTFELKPLGPQTLKGLDAPVPAWAVLRELENVSRFEASRSAGMTPFVGREHEVAQLLDRWGEAADGEGRAALLSGEAGIGKSRILAALRERLADEPHTTMRYQCSPHHVNDAFYPITSHIWQAAGFASGEPTAARLDKLEAMIAHSGLDAEEIAPFLASLLSIGFEGRYPPLEMAPSEQKDRTIAALIALFVGLTKDAPVLALLEDAHWIDPTSLEVFSRLVDRLPGLRALLVITFRPEFVPLWTGRAHVALLTINRFERRQAVALVDRVTGGKALPAEVLEQIVAKTDGVPLFVEELIKTVLESGLLREENGRYLMATALTPLAIPTTLQDSLMARLDRLAPIKEIAQIGAAIGREFSYRLLEAVSPIKGVALQDALGQLAAAQLIHARGASPDAIFVFKHALVQDTAYGSLLRGPRQRVHADLARALEERFADQIDAAPSIIARHYTEAGLAEPAARYWLKAAELAASRSTYVEAARFGDAGLTLIPLLTDPPDRQSLELALQLARANALRVLKGYNASEAVAALTSAKRLLDAGIGDDLQRFSVFNGLFSASLVAGRMEPALAMARQIVAVAERQDDAVYRMIAYRSVGIVQNYMGQHRQALEALQRAERYRDPDRDMRLSYRLGGDPGLSVLWFKIQAMTLLGLLDQAVRTSEQVRAELATHGHAGAVAQSALYSKVWMEFVLGDLEACERRSAELVAYCTEKKVESVRPAGVAHLARARAAREPSAENIAALRAAIDAWRRSGAGLGQSIFIAALGEALLAAGDTIGAEAALQEGFAFVAQSGETLFLADLHRLEGRIALERAQPDRTRAEASFLKAIEIARDQEARLLELRAATDLARLWRDAGAPNDPHALLEPILAAIEGADRARDVRNARALLAEVG